jgi:HSP20 family molecular chaperone IbpA
MFTGHYYPSPNSKQSQTGNIPEWAEGHTAIDDLMRSLVKHEPQKVSKLEKEKLVVKIVVPESSRENFVVEVKEGRLFVTHKVKKETEITKNFETSVLFEGSFVTNSAKARYEAGVLTVEIPREKPKQISVE